MPAAGAARTIREMALPAPRGMSLNVDRRGPCDPSSTGRESVEGKKREKHGMRKERGEKMAVMAGWS